MIKINVTQSRQLQAMLYALNGAMNDLNAMHLPVQKKKDAVNKFKVAIDSLNEIYEDCTVDNK